MNKRNYIICTGIVIILIFLVIITINLQKEEQIGESCVSLGGNFLEEHRECEGISEEQCLSLGGEFNSCASSCRHQPESEVCIMVCVPVCKFPVESL